MEKDKKKWFEDLATEAETQIQPIKGIHYPDKRKRSPDGTAVQ